VDDGTRPAAEAGSALNQPGVPAPDTHTPSDWRQLEFPSPNGGCLATLDVESRQRRRRHGDLALWSPVVDPGLGTGPEPGLVRGRDPHGVLEVGQDVQRCRQVVRVDPSNQRAKVGSNADPEQTASRLECAAHRRGELDVVIEILDGRARREILPESIAVDDDSCTFAQPGGIGVDGPSRVVCVDWGIDDGRTAGDAFHPFRPGPALDHDYDVAFRFFLGPKARGHEAR
jgi:hypothetical protein